MTELDNSKRSTTPIKPSDRAVKVLENKILDYIHKDPFEVFQENCHVYQVPGSEKPDHSSTYRNELVKSEVGGIYPYIDEELNNYYTFFEAIYKIFPNKNLLGKRLFNNSKPNDYDDFYTFQTTSQIRQRRNNFGAGLIQVVTNHKDYQSKISDKNLPHFDLYNNDKPYRFIVSIFSANRLEWTLTDLMCQAYNLTNTALYDTLGPDSTTYIMSLTKSPVVVCSKDAIKRLIDIKRQKGKELETLLVIISMDPLSHEDLSLTQLANDVNINLYDISQVEKLGKFSPVPLSPAGKDDVYTLSFTSGTTGMPKGVVIPQRMFVSCLKFHFQFATRAKHGNPFDPKVENQVRYLCFLPLTHIYERSTIAFSIVTGANIGFPKTNIPIFTLYEDLRLLKPHYFTAVPKVFTKIEANIKEFIEKFPEPSRSIIKKTIKSRIHNQALKDGAEDVRPIFDWYFTKKLRDFFGFTNIEYVVTGSAPISVETLKFLKASLMVGAGQGYGLTESLGGIAYAYNKEKDPGSSGFVGNTTEVRLRDIPSMNYAHDDPEGIPKGELMLRGPQIFSYYYKRPEETAKSFDEDGFFHTGDVAKIDQRGRVFIIDRVKNFFKLAQGEYIAPERIENIYLSNCPLLTQLFIYGRSIESYLVAIAGFEPSLLRNFLLNKKTNLPKHLYKDIAAIPVHRPEQTELFEYINGNSEIRLFLVKALNKMVNAHKKPGDDTLLQGFETIHNFKAELTPLKIEEDTITPTFKLKRNIASKRFSKDLDKLYKEGSLLKRGNL